MLNGALIADFGPFNAQGLSLAVDAFAGGSLRVNGMVEGFVTKVKLIKRQGYGRASFPLLRHRVLHAL